MQKKRKPSRYFLQARDLTEEMHAEESALFSQIVRQFSDDISLLAKDICHRDKERGYTELQHLISRGVFIREIGTLICAVCMRGDENKVYPLLKQLSERDECYRLARRVFATMTSLVRNAGGGENISASFKTALYFESTRVKISLFPSVRRISL